MAEIPQCDPTPVPAIQDGQDETAEVTFTPYLPSAEPEEPSRKPWMILGGCLLLVIGGWLFWPDDFGKVAPDTPPDVSKMTEQELAEEGSMLAATELVRRMNEGTLAQRSAASRVMDRPPSVRLRRNIGMAMALQSQKRATDMNARMAREMQKAEGFSRRPVGF